MWRLLRVDRHAIVDGRVGREDDGASAHFERADTQADGAGLRVRARKDAAAEALGRLRQAREVLQRMELRAARETQGFAEERVRGARHVGEAGPMGRGELAVERGRRVALGEEQVAVDAREVAVDLLLARDRLDAVDGGAMALGGEADPALAVDLLQLEIEVVHLVAEVGARPAGHAAANRPVVEHGDAHAGLRQQVRGRHSCDARADDAGIHLQVALERAAGDRRGGRLPEGNVPAHAPVGSKRHAGREHCTAPGK
jgi:hypothetical protein